MHKLHQFIGRLQLFGSLKELILTHAHQSADLTLHQTHVTHRLNHITRARLALGTNHRGTLGNTAQGLTQVLGTTYKRHVKLRLVDMIDVISRTQHLTLVDIVNLDGLQNLGLGNMTDAALRHHRDAHGLLDTTYHLGVAHTTHTTRCTDVSRDSFEGHDSAGTGSLSNLGLFGSSHVHDNTTLQHLSQLAVEQCSFVCHLYYLFLCWKSVGESPLCFLKKRER